MEWQKVDEDDYKLVLADGIWLDVYLSRLNARWKWGVYGVGQYAGGRVDTEAEAKAAAIAKARELLATNRDELDKALAVLNAAATLEPTP